MTRQHFFFRLIPARPTFVQDMTEGEKDSIRGTVAVSMLTTRNLRALADADWRREAALPVSSEVARGAPMAWTTSWQRLMAAGGLFGALAASLPLKSPNSSRCS